MAEVYADNPPNVWGCSITIDNARWVELGKGYTVGGQAPPITLFEKRDKRLLLT